MKLFEIKEAPAAWLLCEAAEGKNVHLEHVEDLVYNEGYLGAQKALNYMEGLRRMFAQGEGQPVKVTVKWDGAPAIICGTDPLDGKFFVGTKSVFSKNEPPAPEVDSLPTSSWSLAMKSIGLLSSTLQILSIPT